MSTTLYSSFHEYHLIAYGDLAHVLRETKLFLDNNEKSVLMFNQTTGRQVDFDFRGSVDEVVSRALSEGQCSEAGGQSSQTEGKPGPGRPKLGVKSAEVTLLPRHWDWLNAQPAKASGTLRLLVEEARKRDSGAKKRKIEALGTFLWAIAGNLEGFEEASRALYVCAWGSFTGIVSKWPKELSEHVLALSAEIRGTGPEGGPGSLRFPAPLPCDEKAANEPWRLGAASLASRIAKGELSAAEAVASFIARIKAVNPGLNALVRLREEEAMREALEIDSRRARGLPLGPLAGVPFTVKANIDVAGLPTTHGVPALAKAIAPIDAPIVARLRAAGAIPLGQSNMPDLSLRFHTFSSLHGATINPWDRRSSPGGSSGGEGVAIGAGMSPLGLGNDAGGSVRLPALFSGCAALKPSAGRFPNDTSVGPRDAAFASQFIPVNGVLARSTADLHLAYQLLSGPDPRDPRALPAALFGPEPDKPIRVALVKSLGGLRIHEEVARALDAAAEALANAGYAVEDAELPRYAETLKAYSNLVMSEFAGSKAMLEELLGAEGRRYVEFSLSLAKPVDLAGYQGLIALRQGLQRDWAAFLAERPLILGPVFAEPAVPVDADIESLESHARIVAGMGLCSVSSFLGLPALAVPTGLSGDGQPLGVQLIASAFREDLCLEAGLALERALGRIGPIDPRGV